MLSVKSDVWLAPIQNQNINHVYLLWSYSQAAQEL